MSWDGLRSCQGDLWFTSRKAVCVSHYRSEGMIQYLQTKYLVQMINIYFFDLSTALTPAMVTSNSTASSKPGPLGRAWGAKTTFIHRFQFRR